MRVPFTWTVSTLMLVSLTACSHFHPRTSNQQAQAPPLETGQGELEKEAKKNQQPPPASTLPQPTAQVTPPPLPPAKQPKVKRPKRSKTSQKTSDKNQTAAPAATQQATNTGPNVPMEQATANAQAGTASPIGQLTTGDSATQAKAKQDTLNLISTTEQGVGNIKRPLSDEEQATLLRIRTFIRQAKQALDTGDSDGALTLATKAKLLLDELLKQ
jgi:hypothetical protein